MYNIKKMNKISSVIYDYLPKSLFNVSSHLEDDECDGLIVRSADCHGLDLDKRLLAVARAGAGVNNIPVEECTKKGVTVFNTPGANANGVKELVIGCMIAASRNLFEAYDWAKTLKGESDVPKLVEKGKGQFAGGELKDKTLGVIGLGAIGILVANTASAIGMKVIGYDPYLSVEHAWSISMKTRRADDIDELLSQSDFISIHIPQTEQTKNFLSSPEFSKMKPGVILLNFARGGLVKKTSLFDAIDNGTVKKYITDFPDEALLEHPKVISIPHLGASTPESEQNCAVMAAKEIDDFFETGSIVNSVNMPECQLTPTDGTRITAIHDNAPNMMGQITRAIAEMGLNISDMVNKSRGGVAYTVINFDADVPDALKETLEAVPGVIKVRVIKK